MSNGTTTAGTVVAPGRDQSGPVTHVGTWNTAWAAPRSRAAAWGKDVFLPGLEVAVLTEVRLDAFDGQRAHLASPTDSWGYAGQHPQRRKVALWSRLSWRDIDPIGHPGLPPGRFVAGTTDTSFGPVRVIGLCVPWKDAHVRTGRRDAEPWDEHTNYLRHLPPALRSSLDHGLPTVVAGDLNQTIPRSRAPQPVYDLLVTALVGFEVTTAGMRGRRSLIDHIAIGAARRGTAQPTSVGVYEAVADGRELSDHDGVRVAIPAPEGWPIPD